MKTATPRPAPPSPIGRIPVLDVSPVVEGGRFPAKAVVGESFTVGATVFRDGHDAVGATAVLMSPDGHVFRESPMHPVGIGLDRWEGRVQPDAQGTWSFRVEGWTDPYATWTHDAFLKIPAGVDVELMLETGAQLCERAVSRRMSPKDGEHLTLAAKALRDKKRPADVRLAAGTTPQIQKIFAAHPVRDMVSSSPSFPLVVQRERALIGSWYEIFPRSCGAKFDVKKGWVPGTLKTTAKELDRIAAMGFDVVYLTPVSPIGTTNRKGRNNALTAKKSDPGSPYGIGSKDGGHDAIDPALGTFADFDALVLKAKKLGMEVALDLALQCSPDHPWVTEHPEWFTTRLDGTIAFAENPPKKYQDIYPLNFDNDPEGIYEAVRHVLSVWISHGVTIFRVDNPHTKPLPFWQKLIADIGEEHPDIVFLAEAFTRPAMMKALAKIGFHMSYTYFAWRNAKWELEEYLSELAGEQGAYLRPALWPTTHDILTQYMVDGGQAAFAIRAILAATGAPTWGIYSGYELCENVQRPGSEEQIDNEKYEYKNRDYSSSQAKSMAALLTKLNAIRRGHPALQRLRNVAIHHTSDDAILCFSRTVEAWESPAGVADTIIVVVTTDAHNTREATIDLDFDALGLTGPGKPNAEAFAADDMLGGGTFGWDRHPFVRLDPHGQCAHIIHVEGLS